MRMIRLLLGWVGLPVALLVTALVGVIAWPTPLFAYTLSMGRIALASDTPIPREAGETLIRQCDALLTRSPLPPPANRYHLYVTNTAWRHRLFFAVHPEAGGIAYPVSSAFLAGADFQRGRLVKWGYVTPPPRTLAYFCAHEVTHLVVNDSLGVLTALRQPQWVHEGFPDYVGIQNRESFEALRGALGDRPVDIPMMQRYGAYPRFRLLVTYFLERKHWTVDQLLRTRLTYEQATALMHAEPD